MNETLAGLLEILTQGTPDHQVAAAQVLADLRPRETEVAKALATVLENGNHFLKPYALDALAAIRSPAAMRAMVPILQWDGELRERAVRALALLGATAERSLVKEFGQSAPDTKLAIIKICARTRGSSGLDLLKKTLTGADDELASAAAQALAAEIPALEPPERAKLRAMLSTLARGKSALTEDRLAMVVGLLGQLEEESLRPLFNRMTKPAQPPAVRRAALEALARLPSHGPVTVELIELVWEKDFLNLGGPALEVVKRSKLNGRLAPRVAGLLDHDRPEVRLYAIEALGDIQSEASVKHLVKYLGNDDERFRHAAGQSLGKNPAASSALVKKLLAARDLEEMRVVLPPLHALAKKLSPATLKKLCERCHKLIQEKSPLRDLLAPLLWETKPDFVYDFFLQKAKRLRRSKKYEQAMRLLLFLAAAESLFDDEGRYELVMAEVLHEPRQLGERVGDPVLGHVAALVQSEYKLLQRMKREGQLKADQYLYIGYNCIERLHAERRFGTELLQTLIAKWPKTRAAVEARKKLQVEGVE